MAAHLFVLYFGMLSMLTPPVAIAAFVAANMAKARPMATGWEAVRIGWPAYLIPFFFAASPALLFDGPGWEIVLTVGKALIGVYIVTAAIVGFLRGQLNRPERILLAVCGAVVLFPSGLHAGGFWLNGAGVALAAVFCLLAGRKKAFALGQISNNQKD